MSYIPLVDADIEAGKPTKEEIFSRIKDNQDCFDIDIEALKQTAVIDMFDIAYVGFTGDQSDEQYDVRNPIFRAPVNATIVEFRATLLTASTSGTLALDIEKSTDNGINWSTLLSSTVDITGITVGSISGAVNFIDVASQSYLQGDMLRIVVVGRQVDQGNFHVSVYGELA